MKWKYINEEEQQVDQEEEQAQQYFINAAPSSTGAVTRVIENNIYFYGDISEPNALELNAALYELDKKLSITNVFLDIKPVINLHIISVACKKRSIGKYSKMLIHQLSGSNYGKYTELEDDMENNRNLMNTIKEIYKIHTKVPMKKLNEILKRDLWFDSKTCLELGLVDFIN